MLERQLKEQLLYLTKKTINISIHDDNIYKLMDACILEYSELMLMYCCANENMFNEYKIVVNKAQAALKIKTNGGYKSVKAIIYSSIALLIQTESLIYKDCN